MASPQSLLAGSWGTCDAMQSTDTCIISDLTGTLPMAPIISVLIGVAVLPGAGIRILPLGDSITSACQRPENFDAAYRFHLQDDLRAEGIEFDMVGSLTVNCTANGYDRNHEGHGGATLQLITPIAESAVARYAPDVVLLLAGTNNHRDPSSYDYFRDLYEQLFDAIGDTRTFIATVPKFGYDRQPVTNYWTQGFVDIRNEIRFPLMNRVIRELAAERPNFVVVPYYEALDPVIHLGPDALHPNDAGQQLLAELFWEALRDSGILEPPQGDYDDSGRVEQGDLDLVLSNWGSNWTTEIANWVNYQPTDGVIDQNDLDGVVLNWGDSLASTSVVPEPASMMMVLMGAGITCVGGRRLRKCASELITP